MAGSKKHAERSKRSHKKDEAAKSSGLYYMSSVVDRGTSRRNTMKHQAKGAT